jgi:hypothetical protein
VLSGPGTYLHAFLFQLRVCGVVCILHQHQPGPGTKLGTVHSHRSRDQKALRQGANFRQIARQKHIHLAVDAGGKRSMHAARVVRGRLRSNNMPTRAGCTSKNRMMPTLLTSSLYTEACAGLLLPRR